MVLTLSGPLSENLSSACVVLQCSTTGAQVTEVATSPLLCSSTVSATLAELTLQSHGMCSCTGNCPIACQLARPYQQLKHKTHVDGITWVTL